jgi:broad specificity phosphatase PhoE
MALIFCRHGQTLFNIEDRFQGVADSPLSTKGIEQAKELNLFLKNNFNIQKFFISPLPRVKQTYEIASKSIDAELVIEPDLREVCYGNWDGVTKEEIGEEKLNEREKNRFNFIYPGKFDGVEGESYKLVYERVKPFLEKLIKVEAETQGDICIIAHNGILIALVKYFQKLTDEQANSIRVDNDDIIVVKVSGENEFVLENIRAFYLNL